MEFGDLDPQALLAKFAERGYKFCKLFRRKQACEKMAKKFRVVRESRDKKI
jgi:hypothetical protein